MHVLHPAFSMAREEALAFAAERGFGVLVAGGASKPLGSHLPFVVEHHHDKVFIHLHVATTNPLAALADGTRNFLLSVTGSDAYVSNDWYESRDQVSTWLYEAVHLTGPVRRLQGVDNRGHANALVRTFEQRLNSKDPWQPEKMHAEKRAAMLSAIVSLEMTVESVEGQRKFNQHKQDADHIAVVRAMARSVDPACRHMANRLRGSRPHLNYD